MNGWYVFFAVTALVFWAGHKYAGSLLGIGSLPSGYSIKNVSGYSVSSDKLQVSDPNGTKVFTSSYLDIYGYKSCARKCNRAAWTHYYLTKNVEA